ncbi:hypothetical protein [Alloscardovia omnicolens]
MPVHVKVIAVPYLGEVITLTRVGNIVLANGNVKFTQGGQQDYSTANETIPAGYRPTNANTPIICSNINFSLLADAQGKITMLGDPASAYTPMHGMWITSDAV